MNATLPYATPCATYSQLQAFRDSRGEPVERWPLRVLPSVTALIVHGSHWDEGPPWQVLIHQRSDNGWWGFPGGAMEVGESLTQCVIREAYEETGLLVQPVTMTSVDSDPTQGALCAYPDHNVIHYVNHTFLCAITSGTVMKSRESLAMHWSSTATIQRMQPGIFLPTHLWRMEQALAWLKTKQVAVR